MKDPLDDLGFGVHRLENRCSARLSIPGSRNEVKPQPEAVFAVASAWARSGQAGSSANRLFHRTISPSRMWRMRLAIERRLGIVRDHQGGLAQLPVRPQQHVQHRVGVLRVQVAGGLVGQHDGRPA